MTTRTEAVAEKVAARESLVTRNWILVGIIAGLLLFVQALMTFVMTNAAAKMDGYSTGLARVLTAVEVMGVRYDAMTQRVAELEKAKAEAKTEHTNFDVRLRSVEQRAAIHDQFMNTHK